jgi:hypothetical protein
MSITAGVKDGPYFKDGARVMRPSFILYADVLGTTQFWSNRDPHSIKEQIEFIDLYSKCVEELARMLGPGLGTTKSIAVTFSDNIALALPIESEIVQEILEEFQGGGESSFIGRDFTIEQHMHKGLMELVFGMIGLQSFQLDLVRAGFFLRGAAMFGPAFAQEGIVAGPALVDAVLKEEHEAEMPLITVPDWVTELYKIDRKAYSSKEFSVFNSLFAETTFCGKTHRFLNYLGWVDDIRSSDAADGDALVEEHREAVTRNLASAANRVRLKYVWVARYHNWYCQKRGLGFQIPESTIDDPGLDVSFKTIAEIVPPEESVGTDE